jgi:hypothetical protein
MKIVIIAAISASLAKFFPKLTAKQFILIRKEYKLYAG